MDAEERAENAKRKYLARGPGDAATKAYIASKYLGGVGDEETAKKKKKKKKVKSSIQKGNLGIVDEEDTAWRQVGQTEEDEKRKARKQYEREMQDLAAQNSGGVFHGRRDGWHTIQGGHDEEDDTSALRGQNDDEDDIDERPVIVSEGMDLDEETIGAALRAGEGKSPKLRRPRSFMGEDMQRDTAETQGYVTTTTTNTTNTKSGSTVSSNPGDEPSERGGTEPKMSSGQRAGLLTGDALKQEVARAREAEKQALERLKEHSGKDAETVYRDATGRKIDPKIKKAEEERARKEANEQAAQRMEWGKGLVQRSEAEAKRRQLEEEKHKPMARYADDEELNQELKEQQRWNDPAAGFLTSKSTSKSKRVTRPRYHGPWKPNRFMIPPGYRWDGVDRSNHFEDKFLLRQNAKKARDKEAHAWSIEDM
ncbi:Pre-mRNA-splicing factor of RES complex-domain-containing protein [Syncephalastrum racemosum]|uniref:Pre-mRNA-splicing factor of RES complex-domain-containing protein n=1 Tax=Syncephalastrum racemosum TaxID=13706 RepID=A0A1X2HP33_SYNRA|nr:Pre-mRNA-splicing factor of RES complex-domain-containing protein [Syncephalastrum racemosum]